MNQRVSKCYNEQSMWEQRLLTHDHSPKRIGLTKINKLNNKIIMDFWWVHKSANIFKSCEYLCFKCCYLYSSCSHCVRDHWRLLNLRFHGSCSLYDFGSKKVLDLKSIDIDLVTKDIGRNLLVKTTRSSQWPRHDTYPEPCIIPEFTSYPKWHVTYLSAPLFLQP